MDRKPCTQGVGDEAYLVTCRGHSKIRNHDDLVEQMPVMPDQRICPDGPPARAAPRRDSFAKLNSSTPPPPLCPFPL